MPAVSVTLQPVYGLPNRPTVYASPFDVPPAIPSQWDDEFTSSVLGSKWIVPTTSGAGCGVATALGGGWVSVGPAAGLSSRRMFGIRQAAPTGSFTLTAKLCDSTATVNDDRAGIFVGINGGKGNVAGPFRQNVACNAIGVTTASNTADWSSYDGYQGAAFGSTPANTIAWIRIVWNASAATLSFYASLNGNAWTNLGSRSSMSQPDQIGIGIYSNSAATNTSQTIQCDWFRVTTP